MSNVYLAYAARQWMITVVKRFWSSTATVTRSSCSCFGSKEMVTVW